MQIICPHCTTSYAVDPAKFGAGGRTVRCARCHETWLAHPEEIAVSTSARDRAYAAETHAGDTGPSWDHQPRQSEWQEQNAPHIDSPPISGDWGGSENDKINGGDASDDGWADEPPQKRSRPWLGGSDRPSRFKGLSWLSDVMTYIGAHPPLRGAAKNKINLTTACAATGALVFAIVFWRAEVVRLMPQTATFFKMTGLGVNLRGLAFEDIKITTETVNGKPVLVIEGAIADIIRKPVELPRLRFIVRDAQGSDIYAWNSILEQPVLNPGEKVWFKSRLASPPPEGREIAVRFFQRRDIAAGGV